MNCVQIGCQYEVEGDVRWTQKAMSEHLATAHGVGKTTAEAHFGCMWPLCKYEVAGSKSFTAEAMRKHLEQQHGVDPDRLETLPTRGRAR